MRIDRLRLETQTTRSDLHLHPGITLVTGLGPEERQALGTEIIESLRQGRPGLSVDVVESDGRLIEIYRPIEGQASVRDAISGLDLTDRFLHYGSIDLLATDPLPEADETVTATNLLRVLDRSLTRRDGSSWQIANNSEPDRVDPTSPTISNQGQALQQLAKLDQELLWATATALAETELELGETAQEAEPSGDVARGEVQRDATLTEVVEETHRAVQIAADRLESNRSVLLSVSATLAALGLVGAALVDRILAVPFLLGATAAGALSAWRWHQLVQASNDEAEALKAADLTSYTRLRLDELGQAALTAAQTNTAPPGTGLRAIHSLALASWTDLVGQEINVAWALQRQAQVQQLATSLDDPNAATPREANQNMAPPGHFIPWLDRHLTRVAEVYGQAVPVVIDDDFLVHEADQHDLGAGHVAELLRRHSPGLQLIVMTNNPEVLRCFPTPTENSAILQVGSRRDAAENNLLDLRS